MRSEVKAVGEIVEISRRRNAACGITGVLMFDGEHFMQCIEGDALAIDDLITRL